MQIYYSGRFHMLCSHWRKTTTCNPFIGSNVHARNVTWKNRIVGLHQKSSNHITDWASQRLSSKFQDRSSNAKVSRGQNRVNINSVPFDFKLPHTSSSPSCVNIVTKFRPSVNAKWLGNLLLKQRSWCIVLVLQTRKTVVPWGYVLSYERLQL